MEGVSEVSWSSFNTTMSMEESELMAQLLGPDPFSSEQDQDLSIGISSLFWSDSVFDSSYSSQDANSSCYWPLENYNATIFSTSVSTSSFFDQPSDYQTYNVDESTVVPTIDKNHGQMIFNPSDSFGYRACLNEETSSEEAGDSAINSSEQVAILAEKRQHKRKFSMDEVTKPAENDGKIDIASNSLKKTVHEIAKNPKSKKSQKSNASGEDEDSNVNAAPNVQSSGSCSSEDDSNASQELNGGSTSPSSKGTAALNLKGTKARASRGSAADPQSLYARKRRERINERLRILQNLVPNGTKVDISTMLEEAVQYVKFLQLQIKLLSSDDLWMYAPLAYNGMDIGLDLKFSAQQQ